MKIALLGSTGATGRQVVAQALARGDRVRALTRGPRDHAAASDTRVETVTCELGSADGSRRVVEGCDLVISTLGFRPAWFGEKATDLYSRSASVLVEAMNEAGVSRLAFVTSAGVEDDPAEAWAYRHLLKPLYLQKSYDDMSEAERIIGTSTLAWTLVRPTRLTDRPLTRTFRVSPRLRPPGGTRISRADVAFFLLEQANDDAWVRRTPTLAY